LASAAIALAQAPAPPTSRARDSSSINSAPPPLRYRAPQSAAPHADPAARSVRLRSNTLLQTQFTSAEDAIVIRTEPPTRAELFELKSQLATYYVLEKEFLTRSPGQIFMVPVPLDEFNRPNSPTLGIMWWQNRRSGSRGEGDRRAEMGIAGQLGQFPAGAKTEAAVYSETIGSSDMAVRVQVDLGSPESQFGVVVRAQPPHAALGTVDQTDTNTYYYVALSADTVQIGKHVKGKDTLLKRQTGLSAKQTFRLMVTVHGDLIAVLRDNESLVEVRDATVTGEYAGLIGLRATGRPTSFDGFAATRYGGPFVARTFAEMSSTFPGPNVHYGPLYFEQPTLERYGHHLGNLFQPLVAHAMFFGDVALAPYSLGKSPPWEKHSSEGYARPGDVVLPYRVQCPQWDENGAVLQTAVTVLGFSLLP
jgi:hypothetical protein